MGLLASQPSSFVANTKAKASEVNAKFSDVYSVLASATRDIYISTLRFPRLSVANVTMTGSDCFVYAYHQIDSATTYHLATSTARMVFIGELEIKSGGTLQIDSGAEVYIA